MNRNNVNNADLTVMDGSLMVTKHAGTLFLPDNPVEGRVEPYRICGTGQMLSNGTFEFMPKPRLRPQSELIRKLRHGRVSRTKDGAIQLTLKIDLEEGFRIPLAIHTEALEGEKAAFEYLLKVKR